MARSTGGHASVRAADHERQVSFSEVEVPGEVVDMEVPAVLGRSHAEQIAGERRPAGGVTADRKDLPFRVKADEDPTAGGLLHLAPRQAVAARRGRGAEQPLAIDDRASQAAQLFCRRHENNLAEQGVADKPPGWYSFKVGPP